MTNIAKHTPLRLISGKECPSCGRDNSADGEFCNFEECPGVMIYDAAPELLEALRNARKALAKQYNVAEYYDLINTMDSAIAKVEGRE